MYEAVEFVERDRGAEPTERLLGEFTEELVAVEQARQARDAFSRTASDDYAWWIVREKGATLASFIADSKSEKEFVLDLRSGGLVEVPS